MSQGVKHQVRKQTFEDVVAEKPITELPVVFEGTHEDVLAFLNSQPGYVRRDARKLLFGAFWYNRDEATALLPS